SVCKPWKNKRRGCGQGRNRTADTRRQPQAQGVIPSVMAFCKPAQSLPVLPKAKPKPAPTNIPFCHKTGTFFPLHKQRPAYPPAKGGWDEGSTLRTTFFAYETKRQLCIYRGFLV